MHQYLVRMWLHLCCVSVADVVQCGCECTLCTLKGSNVRTNSQLCNDQSRVRECLRTNEDNCGPQYSDDSQIIWCEISNPSSFPPLYDLTRAIFFPGGESADSSTERYTTFLWTESADTGGSFADGAMQRFVRQPDIASALSNADVVAGLQVCDIPHWRDGSKFSRSNALWQ
jgi:hypothetical protein